MKKAVKWFGSQKRWFCALACIALIGFSFAACDAVGLGGGGSGGGSGDVIGIWAGTVYGQELTVTITADRWTSSMPGWGSDTGTYIRRGNTAVLFSDNLDGIETGTAELIDSDTIRFTANSYADFPGTHILHKVY